MIELNRPSLKLALRTFARALVGLVLRLRSDPCRFAGTGDAVVIAPHPDDETLGCGGLMSSKRKAGATIHIVFLTDGTGSHPNHPNLTPTALKVLRHNEAVQAASTLKVPVTCLTFLDVADGTLAHLPLNVRIGLVARLSALLKHTEATDIFLPFARDGSSEHEAAFKIVRAALGDSGGTFRVLQFPVWAWWSPLLLWRAATGREKIWHFALSDTATKRAALACYPSQLQPLSPWLKPVLPDGFAAAFQGPHEYFFEASAP